MADFTFLSAEGVLNRCLEKTTAAFGLPDGSDISAIVPNCSYVLYLVNEATVSAANTNTSKTIFCAACQSGFKPIYTSGKISACEAIANCATDNSEEFFNICPACATDFEH